MELAIDTASDLASIALTEAGRVVAEYTWQAQRQHSRMLLSAIDAVLDRHGLTKQALGAVFVSTGPGSYAGVRVGLSVAKGLAFALETPIVGIGRLEIDAYQHAAYPGPVCAIHQAGRKELAWALYQMVDETWQELRPPRLSRLETLLRETGPAVLYCGDIEGLSDSLKAAGRRYTSPAASVRRAGFLAELGWYRLQAGYSDDVHALAPVYLREPAIGPPQNEPGAQ